MTDRGDWIQAGPATCRLGAARILPLIGDFEKEIEGVKAADDIEYVHRMRVASRRLRAALPLFASCVEQDRFRQWTAELKKITKALGEARDTDVQLAFLYSRAKVLKKQTVRASTPHQRARANPEFAHEIDVFIHRLTRRRSMLQQHVLVALEHLEQSGVIADIRKAFLERLNPPHPVPHGAAAAGLSGVAAERIAIRLDTFLGYEPFLADPDAIAEHHAMRIAAKKLRYTLEVYAPLYRQGLAKPLRRVKKMQSILGDIHDCDVWIDLVTTIIVKERGRTRTNRPPGPGRHSLTGLRLFLHDRERDRSRLHRIVVRYWASLKRAGIWEELKSTLYGGRKKKYVISKTPSEQKLAGATEQIAEEFPETLSHSRHVTMLALSIYDQTAQIHRLPARSKSLLSVAGMLHDIGWKYGQKSHSSRSREMILLEERLPLDLQEKIIVGIIARSHRKGVFPESDPLYSLLPENLCRSTGILSGILRVADGLDFLHASSVQAVKVSISRERITITPEAGVDVPSEKNRARAKSDLLSMAFSREVVIL